MKTYKIWEVLKMLSENRKLRFECEEMVLNIDENGFLEGIYNGNQGLDDNVDLDDEWTLVQESIPFMEAVKVFMKGQSIRCEFPSSIREDKTLTQVFAQSTNGIGVKRSSDELNFYMINSGKWFIQEDEK